MEGLWYWKPARRFCLRIRKFSRGLISEYRKGLRSTGDSNVSNASSKMCRIEVPDVDNLGVFRDTIELMFEDNITKRLLKIGVYRAIDILEVSVISFMSFLHIFYVVYVSVSRF